MNNIIRSMKWTISDNNSPELLLSREWLVTNGLGGYASGTIGGVTTRRYHSLLNAALPSPLGRTNMFNHISERIQTPEGQYVQIGSEEPAENLLKLPSSGYLIEFRLEAGLPVWTYNIEGVVIEKYILMPYMQNSVHIRYKLLSGHGPIRLELRPYFHFRHHESAVDSEFDSNYKLIVSNDRYEIQSSEQLPNLKMKLYNREGALTVDGGIVSHFYYRLEAERGYESGGVLYNPGYFRAILVRGQEATLVASTDSWDTILALRPDEAFKSELERKKRLIQLAHPSTREGIAAELVLAADQFIMAPAGRVEDAARARASGDEVRSIIAGYHWFTDWGRDTMISLEGLTLTTGRQSEARWILRTFAHYIKDGLLPNMFPEGEKDGLYHTADATLWFFHALERYIRATEDNVTLDLILPKLIEIAEFHIRGTRFGIGVDHSDGLLKQGAEGYQLTWMDAKVEDWVVTPRRGKAVEINALWYNALKLLEKWLLEVRRDDEAAKYHEFSERAKESFNKRFWNEETGCLYDIIDGEDGDDPAIRPNQVFAISLDYPILERDKWEQVLTVVKEKLLTPVGLRSLAPEHPDYKAKYFGNLRARDAAYHQGTVWGWLIGHFIDAWLKINPDDKTGAQKFLDGFISHLGEACIGSISEIFDAEEPFQPRGCVAQAWSIAEVLRSWVTTGKESQIQEVEKEMNS
jgi:predicted glycogen debranching enzyme